MKKLIILLLIFIPALAMGDETKKCADCPADKPCGYSEPAGDGCNTCSGETWCVDGKWFTTGLRQCTLLGCIRAYEIPNPFGKTATPANVQTP
jgi:hypothetical protein